MKKTLKTLLPIASVAAIVAPVACLTSCSKTLFVCNRFLDGSDALWSKEKTGEAGVEYTVEVSLSKLGKGPFASYKLGVYGKHGEASFSNSGCRVIFDDADPVAVTPTTSTTISGTAPAQYNSIKFIVYLELVGQEEISFYFSTKLK